jgi:hypothetical protein
MEIGRMDGPFRATMKSTPLLASLLLSAATPPREPPWGAHGHRIAAEAAVRAMPEATPDFFVQRIDQLVYLDPEPDRWRDGRLPEMDRAFAYEHYIDLERIPAEAVEAGDRWTYLEALHRTGLEHPAREGGLLPFRIVELHQRLTSAWRRWRSAGSARERRWIEDWIVNDAGILGHYVTDASQPHHTTIHFDGWDPETPNPENFDRAQGFHARFEGAFVDAHVNVDDLATPLAARGVRTIRDVRAAVLDHIMESHERVSELYRLDRDIGFDPERSDPRTEAFAVERLVAGARMLRDLWWTAWRLSEGP